MLPCTTAALALALAARDARASVLRVRAPDQCVEASEISERVETLLARPLGAVEGVDFEVEIARPTVGKRWAMRLDRINRGDGDGARSSRAMTGDSCGELAEAAALAIAISIRAREPIEVATADQPALAAPPAPIRPLPAPVQAQPPSASARPPSPVASAGASPVPAAPRGSLTVAAIGDAGALPSAGVGAALELGYDVGHWRFAGLGALFASRTARVGSVGGDFDLAFGAALFCRLQPVARVVALGCAGAEVGRLSGQGIGVDAPRLGRVLWLAPRAEVGAGIPLGSTLTLVARAGVAVPLSRPVFVADEAVQVHQASRVNARGTLGVQLYF